jgi:hypothetical protein
MPARRPGLAGLLLALALGACAAPGTVPGAGPAKDAAGGEARAMVTAFGHICGRLDRAEVARRAGTYGFAPIRRDLLPADAQAQVARGEATIFIRPSPGTPMLFWNEAPRCELVFAGLPQAEVETEFTAFLEALARTGELTVATASPEQLAQLRRDGPAEPRKAAVVTPRVMVPGGQRTFMLLVSNEGPRAPVVSMVTARAGTGGGAAASTRELPKDPAP